MYTFRAYWYSKMAEDECDLEALLDVLDEDDGVEISNEPASTPEEAGGGEEDEDDEQEIQRQLQEMEAKMRAMKEKLNKKNRTSSATAAASPPADRPLSTASGAAAASLPVASAARRPSVAVAEIDVFRHRKSCKMLINARVFQLMEIYSQFCNLLSCGL